MTEMEIGEALQTCIQVAWQNRHLARGLNECARALERRAVMCVFSRECAEENYTKLIMAMCREHNIPIVQVDDSKQLALWSNLAKIDEDGEVKRWPKCTCVVITQWDPKSTDAQNRVQSYVQQTSS